jgi:hypothetical protein
MARTHNKKRNVGIIYEQIMNFICEQLMNDNKSQAEKAINIIRENFKKDSQLYKEFKLFKALAETHNISENLANLIITEAKNASNNMFDSEKLEKEKSKLIKDLNYTFGKGKIFESNVKNYKTYATIQTLLNEWRSNDSNFDKTTEYEIQLHNKLTQKVVIEENVEINQPDKLTRKLMKEIFYKKYNSLLSENQQKLINTYINFDDTVIEESFSLIKNNCIDTLEKYMNSCSNVILNEKYSKVKNNIKDLNESNITKENLNKFLIAIKLSEEIAGEE